MFRISGGGASMHSLDSLPLVPVVKALQMFPYLEALVVVCVSPVNPIYSATSHRKSTSTWDPTDHMKWPDCPVEITLPNTEQTYSNSFTQAWLAKEDEPPKD